MKCGEFRGIEHTFEVPDYRGVLNDTIKAETKVTLDDDNGTLVQKVGWKNQLLIFRKPGEPTRFDSDPEDLFKRRVMALGLGLGKKCLEQMVGYSPDEGIVITKHAGTGIMHIPAESVKSIEKQTWSDLLATLQDVTPKGVALDTGGISNMVFNNQSGLTLIDYTFAPEETNKLGLTGERELANIVQLMHEELYYPEEWDKVMQQGLEVLKDAFIPGVDSRLDSQIQYLSEEMALRAT